jgi:hypothetical protein
MRVALGKRNAVGNASLAVAFITLLAIGTDLFVVSPLLPAIAQQYGVVAGVAGNAVTLFSLAYMFAAPAMGLLADRVGRPTMLYAVHTRRFHVSYKHRLSPTFFRANNGTRGLAPSAVASSSTASSLLARCNEPISGVLTRGSHEWKWTTSRPEGVCWRSEAPDAVYCQAEEERPRWHAVDVMSGGNRSFERTSEEEASLDTQKGREDQSQDSTDALLPLKDPDSALISNDPELKKLAAHLEMTAPEGAVDPAFRESLRSRIIEILREHQASKTSGTVSDMAQRIMRDEQPVDRSEKAE